MTDAGQIFLAKVHKPMLDILDAADAVRGKKEIPAKRYSIGCYSVTRERLLSGFLEQLLEKSKGCTFTIIRKTPPELLEELLQKKLDAVLIAPADLDRNHGNYSFFPLHKVSLVCVLPRKHILSKKHRITPENLSGNLLVVPTAQRYTWNTLQYIRDFAFHKIPGVQVLESDDANVTDIMLQSYSAITIRPDYAAVEDDVLTSVPLSCDYEMEYGLAVLPERANDFSALVQTQWA